MNSSKGIFEGVPGPSEGEGAAPSPFKAMADERGSGSNPFASSGAQPSPFAVGDDDDSKAGGEAAKLPEPRPKPAGEPSPFQLAEPSEGYGFEAAEQSGAAPFAASPFGGGQQGAGPESKPAAPAAVTTPAAEPARPAAAPAPVSSDLGGGEIRQLELRAIFGVDRELSADEILQRLRSLAGIRNVVRVPTEGVGAVDVLRRSLAGLATDNAPLRISFGGAPVEFVSSGSCALAVMNDGSFAPGVRETMIIAARELDRMS